MKGNRQNSIIHKFRNKLIQRSIVFVLLVSLLMTAMPVYAISSSNTPELNETIGTNEIDDNTIVSTETDSTTTIPTKLTDKDNVYISAEEVSKRGEFEKHYLLSDGSFVAVSYLTTLFRI